MAKRTRAASACARCKQAKMKCSDSRPCKQCAKNNILCSEQRTAHPSVVSDNTTMFLHTQDLDQSRTHFGISKNNVELLEPTPIPSIYGQQQTFTLDQVATYGPILPRLIEKSTVGFSLNRVGPSSYESIYIDRPQEATTQSVMPFAGPHSAQPNPMMASSLLPHAVAALLCGLTRPVPHPPPPPNALGMLLAMASGIAPLQPSDQLVLADLRR